MQGSAAFSSAQLRQSLEARRRLPEAVHLFLEESQRMGTLQDIIILNNLRTAGISREEYFSLLEKA